LVVCGASATGKTTLATTKLDRVGDTQVMGRGREQPGRQRPGAGVEAVDGLLLGRDSSEPYLSLRRTVRDWSRPSL
jgi:hypothetical protein